MGERVWEMPQGPAFQAPWLSSAPLTPDTTHRWLDPYLCPQVSLRGWWLLAWLRIRFYGNWEKTKILLVYALKRKRSSGVFPSHIKVWVNSPELLWSSMTSGTQAQGLHLHRLCTCNSRKCNSHTQHEWSLLEQCKVMGLPRILLSCCSPWGGLKLIVQGGNIYLPSKKMEEGTDAKGGAQGYIWAESKVRFSELLTWHFTYISLSGSQSYDHTQLQKKLGNVAFILGVHLLSQKEGGGNSSTKE